MDIYQKKSRWKVLLFLAAIVIVVISMTYTNILTYRLGKEERKMAQIWGDALAEALKGDTSTNFTFITNILSSNTTIPAILTDEHGNIIDHINLNPLRAQDEGYLQQQLKKMESLYPPLKAESFGDVQYIYHKNSYLYTMLTYFPYFQLTLVGLFLLFAYLAFNSARRAEQNQVWIGLAKETAHQLGTPISSLVAWIEHLKISTEGNEYVQNILTEFRKDIGRLELIADRFSKIGAKPVLQAINIYDTLERTFLYMQRRAPRRVKFHYPDSNQTPIPVAINAALFDWVIENLLKNALDALDGKGTITATVFDDNTTVTIDIRDTGKGIPSSKLKTVFEPGFTTKKRGWGLGLSLSKRIVEDYHSGKIFVKESGINKGTTFRIQLRKNA